MAAKHKCLLSIALGLILTTGARAQEPPDTLRTFEEMKAQADSILRPVRAELGLDNTASHIPQYLLEEYAKATVDGWVWFGGASSTKQHYWFLPKTIRKTPRGTSTVWAVNIQAGGDTTTDWTASRQAIIAQYEERGWSTVGYEKYVLTKVKWEIDCVHQQSRILQFADYAEDGRLLHSGEVPGKLEDPIPETNGEGIIRMFCNPRLRKTFLMLMGPSK